MKDFIKLDVVLDYDSKETQKVYINSALISSIKKKEEDGTVYIIKMVDGDVHTVRELPESLTL